MADNTTKIIAALVGSVLFISLNIWGLWSMKRSFRDVRRSGEEVEGEVPEP